jgi:hypothetical protein
MGDSPKPGQNLVVKDPTLLVPTAKHTSATGQLVTRSRGGRPLEPPGQQVLVR